MKVHYPTVYDDHLAREAMTRYYTQVKGWECKCLDRYSKIDMVARKENGTIIVLELMCNACWTNQFTYPNDCIHIPWRKFKTFYTQTKDVPSLNVNRADRGYLIVFNTMYTRAGVISFSEIIEPLAMFDAECLTINDEQDIFIFVPISFIKKYIDIPPK